MLALSVKSLITGTLAFLAALVLVLGLAQAQAAAQEPNGLVPNFGDGRLVVAGSGFKSGEEVTLTVVLNDDPAQQFTTTADSQGRFRLDTGLAVPAGASVKLEARGNQGTVKAAITSAPASLPPASSDPSGATSRADFSLSNGWFYTQASGQSGRGFAVTDEAGVQFWSEFQRLGGVPGVGYPISQRFVWDGFVSQAFQKMVFQWRPEVGRVYAINVLDLMHEQGLDGWLQVVRATPPIADWSADRGRTWPQIVAAHQALLTDPDIRAAYFAVDDPVTLYGLPMAPIQNMGNVLVLRMQRGIIQKWLVDVPWARSGQVTIANSGDVAKEARLLPTTALQPVPAPRPNGSSPIELTLTAEPRVTSGQPVELTLRVTNRTPQIIRWWTGLPIADFVAQRNSAEYWRWSAGRAFPAIARQIELAPGETQIYRESWPIVDGSGTRVPRGEYQLVGMLTSSPSTGPDDLAHAVSVRSTPVTVTVR